MNLESSTITMTYVDDSGDQIVIGSDDDLSVMENLTGNKSYVKVKAKLKALSVDEISKNCCWQTPILWPFVSHTFLTFDFYFWY